MRLTDVHAPPDPSERPTFGDALRRLLEAAKESCAVPQRGQAAAALLEKEHEEEDLGFGIGVGIGLQHDGEVPRRGQAAAALLEREEHAEEGGDEEDRDFCIGLPGAAAAAGDDDDDGRAGEPPLPSPSVPVATSQNKKKRKKESPSSASFGHDAAWQCERCTLINRANAPICVACEADRSLGDAGGGGGSVVVYDAQPPPAAVFAAAPSTPDVGGGAAVAAAAAVPPHHAADQGAVPLIGALIDFLPDWGGRGEITASIPKVRQVAPSAHRKRADNPPAPRLGRSVGSRSLLLIQPRDAREAAQRSPGACRAAAPPAARSNGLLLPRCPSSPQGFAPAVEEAARMLVVRLGESAARRPGDSWLRALRFALERRRHHDSVALVGDVMSLRTRHGLLAAGRLTAFAGGDEIFVDGPTTLSAAGAELALAAAVINEKDFDFGVGCVLMLAVDGAVFCDDGSGGKDYADLEEEDIQGGVREALTMINPRPPQIAALAAHRVTQVVVASRQRTAFFLGESGRVWRFRLRQPVRTVNTAAPIAELAVAGFCDGLSAVPDSLLMLTTSSDLWVLELADGNTTAGLLPLPGVDERIVMLSADCDIACLVTGERARRRFCMSRPLPLGALRACALSRPHTPSPHQASGAVWTFGGDWQEALGLPESEFTRMRPSRVPGFGAPSGRRALRCAVGEMHTVILTTSGEA